MLSDCFGYEGILPIGINSKIQNTISGTPDSILFEGNSYYFFEYSTNKNFKKKLTDDLEKVKNESLKNKENVKKFIFISNRKSEKINNLDPREFIKKKYGWDSHIIDQEALRVALDTNRFLYIRKRYLNIPYDYFISPEGFEKLFLSKQKKSLHYTETFFNRENEIKIIKKFVSESKDQILIIHANGGIGKTRLVFEAVKLMQSDKTFVSFEFLFIDPYQNDVHIIDHLHEIPPIDRKKSIIIIDDAHKIKFFNEFPRILLERENSKLLIMTRTSALEKIKYDLGDFTQVEKKLKPMTHESIKNQLLKLIKVRLNTEALDYIVYFCKGSPLIAEIFANVINKRKAQDLIELKNCDPLKDYFTKTLNEFEQNQKEINKKYKPYLAIIFGTRPFYLSDDDFRKNIRKLLNIDNYEENQIINNLIKSNTIEKSGNILTIYLDLLGEYIFNEVFFNRNPLISIENLINLITNDKLKALLKTIREINNKESIKFLLKVAEEIESEIKEKNNDSGLRLLEFLEIFAYVVPKNTISIIQSLIEGEIILPKKYTDPYKFTGHDHVDVLIKCLDILGLIKHQLFEEVLDLHTILYFYEKENLDCTKLREKALEKLEGLSKFYFNIIRQKGYFYQKILFNKISKWIYETPKKYFLLITKLSKNLLSSEVVYEYTSPLNPNEFHFGRPPLDFND